MRHKHADIIIEWAETGRKLQYVDSYGEWHDVLGTPCWHAGTKYRFKPEVIKYKTALFVLPGGRYLVETITTDSTKERDLENVDGFVKWIDTEWQEVEI